MEKPQDVIKKCGCFVPTIQMMQVTDFTPWKLDERMKLRNEARRLDISCKIDIIVDENAEKKITNEVKQA